MLSFWLLAVLGFWLYTKVFNLNVVATLKNYLEVIGENPFSLIIILVIFLIRPLILLPSTILVAFVGFLYGAILGFIYSQLAVLASCALAYVLGRYFSSSGHLENKYRHLLKSMKENSFTTVLLSRLLFVPGDLVNYLAGFLKIHFGSFLAGTLIGGTPSLLIVVLAGAAMKGSFAENKLNLHWDYLLAAVIVMLLCLLVYGWWRKRQPPSV